MKILFVDDEERILQGMKRSLRRKARDWEMIFCCGGREALEQLEREPCDVIVSDMRMPEMSGAELLREVMERYPQTIRIVLSGHSGIDSVMSAFGVSHQYLAKPCDADKLRETIERTARVQAMLASEPVRAVVSRVGSLPSLPRELPEAGCTAAGCGYRSAGVGQAD